MKRYVKSARSESDYLHTDVIHLKVPKTSDAIYNVVREQLIALSKDSANLWYVHVDSNNEYTIYVDADKTSSDQVKNLIEIRFKNIISVFTRLEFI